ncbi:MAG TPA: magnesium transporter [Tepidisphaeraceae bacterium]|jgi:magnesium transporter|nr:magnesium transporter [Tepidisphaeraceae bacterium]
MNRDSREIDEREAAHDAPTPDSPAPAEPDRDVAQRIEELTPTDGAQVLEKLPRQFSADVTEYLDPNTAAAVLSEMDPAQAAAVISRMEPPEASMVLAAMEPDDRVDILEHISGPLHDQLLGEMTLAEAAQTRQLEQYPPDTAGGIMTPEVTALDEDLTVGQAIEELRRFNETLEQMFYVYVVDKRGHLVGVLSMRDLIMSRPEKRLSQIMRPTVTSVPATMDQEEVARVFRDRNYLAMPVVDDKNKLLGIITVDDVVDVIQEEATEDVQKMFGAGAEERLSSPWHFSFRKRVGWLIVNLATAFMAGWVVSLFDPTISKLTVLAVYMPIVAGMGGNTSAQAMSVAIRGLSTGKVDRALLRHLIMREVMVGVLTGLAIGLITAAVAMLWQRKPMLGLVVGLALLINHTLASISGAGIPMLMKKLGFDPAQSATIFATTVTDIAGFFSLLGLAYLFMKYLI